MTQDRLREALDGVRGFVLDADGVLVLRSRPLPGSMEAVTRLGELGIPLRVVTNFSQLHRHSLSDWFGAAGLRIDPERIITGTSATSAYTAAHHTDRPLFVLAAADALREFDGQRLVFAEEADALPPGSVAAVVIGDAGDGLSYGNMDVAFRLIHRGAELLAMHRNPWWLTPKGMTLDAGGYVAALEFATGQRARILGKPAPEVFRQAIAGLRSDLGERAPAVSFVMVGDDPRADIAAAQRVGMRGVLVLSGKTSQADLATHPRRGRGPDGIAATLADVVAALD